MENGGKLKTEHNLYNGIYNDGNFYDQSKRQVRGVNLFLFRNDPPSTCTFSKKVFRTDIHRHIDGAALSQKQVW